jgi:parallel beta-helix repeat protein
MDCNDLYANDNGITGYKSVLSLRGNRICDNMRGILLSKSRAKIEHNEISNNKLGVFVTNSSHASIQSNAIHSNRERPGVVLLGKSNASIIENTIRENRWGVHMLRGSRGILRRNAINSNSFYGVIVDAATATIEDNDLRGNLIAPMRLHSGSLTKVRQARNIQ